MRVIVTRRVSRLNLETDAASSADGRLRFHLRIAANVLRTVERELALGPAQLAAHDARLRRLGIADDAELAAAVRGGAFDGRMDELLTALRDAVRAKLEVANPAHLEQG